MTARTLPILTILAMLGPVAAGLYGTVLPAFNHMPLAGLNGPSLAPFEALFDWPGLWAAMRLSVTTGVGSTLIALVIVTLLTAGWSGTDRAVWVDRTRNLALVIRVGPPP